MKILYIAHPLLQWALILFVIAFLSFNWGGPKRP
jgi:lipopolysaccharide export LptBFGC system permease protein LptF